MYNKFSYKIITVLKISCSALRVYGWMSGFFHTDLKTDIA